MNAPSPQTRPASTAFFSKTYDEALALVRQTRDYLKFQGQSDAAGLDHACNLGYSAETSRLTARLTHMMAWLLLQRAVHRGELSGAEALAEAPNLSRVEVCLAPPFIDPERLPRRLAALLEQSERLYLRIARLDEMARRAAG